MLDAISSLRPEDLGRTVTIRGEAHTVVQAINRQVSHYSVHVGQIVLLAKHFAGPNWQTLSIPKSERQESGGALDLLSALSSSVSARDASRSSRSRLLFFLQPFELGLPHPAEPAIEDELHDLMQLAAIEKRAVAAAHIDDGA